MEVLGLIAARRQSEFNYGNHCPVVPDNCAHCARWHINYPMTARVISLVSSRKLYVPSFEATKGVMQYT